MVASSFTPTLKKTGVMEKVIVVGVEAEAGAAVGGRAAMTESGTGSMTLRAHLDPVTRGNGITCGVGIVTISCCSQTILLAFGLTCIFS